MGTASRNRGRGRFENKPYPDICVNDSGRKLHTQSEYDNFRHHRGNRDVTEDRLSTNLDRLVGTKFGLRTVWNRCGGGVLGDTSGTRAKLPPRKGSQSQPPRIEEDPLQERCSFLPSKEILPKTKKRTAPTRRLGPDDAGGERAVQERARRQTPQVARSCVPSNRKSINNKGNGDQSIVGDSFVQRRHAEQMSSQKLFSSKNGVGWNGGIWNQVLRKAFGPTLGITARHARRLRAMRTTTFPSL